MNSPAKTKVVMFDLDGTLAKSKQAMDAKGLRLLSALTWKMPVILVGGGKKELFWHQVIRPIARFHPNFGNLRVMPTNGASLYVWRKKWRLMYEVKLTKAEDRRVRQAIKEALENVGFERPARLYGRQVENRVAQITFSAIGQHAPLSVKEKWNRMRDDRKVLLRELRRLLPDLDVHEAGLTSIDITRRGIDKAYAVKRARKHFNVEKSQILFVGDAIFPGGNDYPAKKAGVPCIKVKGPEETKRVIKRLLAN